MPSTYLNEHDANQGAQSSGEFLGMTGNSGWYLLGSAGATILMVIVLWGIFGVPLLLCLLVGIVLCVGSVAYVFLLKNNKPAHYDTDFLESALIEAGLLQFAFGPRSRRPVNPFADLTGADFSAGAPNVAPTRRRERVAVAAAPGRPTTEKASDNTDVEPDQKATAPARKSAPVKEPAKVSPDAGYEQLQEQLATTEEMLEDALAERGED